MCVCGGEGSRQDPLEGIGEVERARFPQVLGLVLVEATGGGVVMEELGEAVINVFNMGHRI